MYIFRCLVLTLALSHVLKAQIASQIPPPIITFSIEGGLYSTPQSVTLHAPDARIYYTLDGQEPTRRSFQYRGAIDINQTTTVRAIAYQDGEYSSSFTQTYFIQEPVSQIPVVALSISPQLLFDPVQGLFVQGSQADTIKSAQPGANFWSRREVKAHLEFYEANGEQVLNHPIGFRLFGGMSRLFPQKSIALVAREDYGPKKMDYPVFGKKEKSKFKYLILRNSGSDWGRAHLRDPLIATIVKDWNLDVQAYRPAHVYLNGSYWGIYNIREKINRHFLASHHDVDKDSINLLEHYMTLKQGSRRPYQRLLSFMHEHDISDPINYAIVRKQIDVDNFIDHQIAQIFFDNRDAGGNIRFWQPESEGARWRWILYDTDWGLGLHFKDAVSHNSLAFHTDSNGPNWPNPPWSTFMLRTLLTNDAFRARFINRFADRLNTDLHAPEMLYELERMYQTLQPEMPRHLERWRIHSVQWDYDLKRIRNFLHDRPSYVWDHIQEMFASGDKRTLQLEASEGGRVELNKNLIIKQQPFRGQYFERIPVTLRAIPNYGYQFSHWEGLDYTGQSHELFLKLDRKEGYRLKAVFKKFDHPLAGVIHINEISPNNKKSEDWVELYNSTDQRISLSTFILRDGNGNAFQLPEQAQIGPNDYLVICEDEADFKLAYPRAYNVIGDLDFGINKHQETIEIFTPEGALIDSVSYTISPSDSTFTLELLLPRLDNSEPENWKMSLGDGSPNAANAYFVTSSIRKKQTLWMQIGLASAVIMLCILMLFFRHYLPSFERHNHRPAYPTPNRKFFN